MSSAVGVSRHSRARDEDRQVEARLVRGVVAGLVVEPRVDEDVRPEREKPGRQRHERDERDRQSRPNSVHSRRSLAGCLVARAADGEDEFGRGRIGLDLGAEALDRDIDEAGIAEVVVAPDTVEQHVTRQDLAGVAGELDEQVELRPGQRRPASGRASRSGRRGRS